MLKIYKCKSPHIIFIGKLADSGHYILFKSIREEKEIEKLNKNKKHKRKEKKVLPLNTSHKERKMETEKAIINGVIRYIYGLSK